MLFVSHNMGAVQTLCSRCLLIDHGRIVCDSDTSIAIAQYVEGSGERASNRVSLPRRPGVAAQVLNLWVEVDDREVGEVALGSDVTAVVQYAVEGNPRGVVLALLVSREGTPLLYTYDSDANPSVIERRDDGEFEARVRLPLNLFKEGHYQLAAFVGHGAQDLTDPRAALDFVVVNATVDATHRSFRRDRPGHLVTYLDWETERSESGLQRAAGQS